MFTGIIEALGTVREKTETALRLSCPDTFTDVRVGASVAVAGVCLSVVRRDATSMQFDVVPETWKRTTLGALEPGSTVNLERALSVQGRFEGHVVQGHVEGTAEVQSCLSDNESGMLTIRLPKKLREHVIPKGSIAIDGVSLTIASLDGALCSLALIPHTIASTTLGLLKVDDRVNVETDILVRAIREHAPTMLA